MTFSNHGIVNSGLMTAGNIVVGDNSHITHTASPPMARQERAEMYDTDLGILTVLSVETGAVVEMLSKVGGYRIYDKPDGVRLHRATVPGRQRPIEVAAMQVVEQGQRSAALAVQRFRDLCSPAVVALVGIAGGIHPSVAPGAVVVSDEVVYYDLRKEVRGRTIRRGQVLRASVLMRHRLNHFFSERGEPCERDDPERPGHRYRIHRGPIGSGEAVVAYSRAQIRRYLRAFNDKVLAVEMEAGGVAQACYEASAAGVPANWVSVRGAADLADENKDDEYHVPAARRAAATLAELIPFISGP